MQFPLQKTDIFQQVSSGTSSTGTLPNYEAISNISGVVRSYWGHNTWTAIGKGFNRNAIFFANTTDDGSDGKVGWVSLGNATVSESLTKLTSEATTAGATRKAFDTLVPFNNATYVGRMVNGTVTFSFTGTIRVDAVGFNWNSTSNTDNNLYAAFAISGGATTFNNGDTYTVKYYHRSDGT